MASYKDKEAQRDWDAHKKSIEQSTVINSDEDFVAKKTRIQDLLKDGNHLAFLQYYFPHYCSAGFGDFQTNFLNYIVEKDRAYCVNKWSRDHAKSVTVILAALYLKFKKKASNLILASHTETNATELLAPLRLELEANQRLINDFGKQQSLGNWTNERIVTNDGFSARAIGAGQSPRGTRNEEARPDIIICDDIDTEEVCRNPKRLRELWEWVAGSLFGCFSIKGRKRFIIVGNKIGKDCIIDRAIKECDFTQQIDIITKGPIDKKYIAEIEKELQAAISSSLGGGARKGGGGRSADADLKVHRECLKYAQLGYKPTWHQRFTLFECVYMIMKMGTRMSQREYFNNPTSEGSTFKTKWMQFKQLPPMRQYKKLVAYLDPGFKKTETSDSKCLILVGMISGEIHIRKVYCGKASIEEMIEWCYSMHEYIKIHNASYRLKMEEVFLQSLLYKDFAAAGQKKYPLPVSGDTRKKPDKDARIEAMSGHFERGTVYFDIEIEPDHHTQALIEQFLNFEPGVKSLKDGPDAFEGAVHLLEQGFFTDPDDIDQGMYNKSKHKI
jgi:hypothetical protein